jgi:hypothetical protein
MNTVITNMVSGCHENLSEIGRISEYFLVTGHPGVKANFTAGSSNFADGVASEYGAILQNKQGWL